MSFFLFGWESINPMVVCPQCIHLRSGARSEREKKAVGGVLGRGQEVGPQEPGTPVPTVRRPDAAPHVRASPAKKSSRSRSRDGCGFGGVGLGGSMFVFFLIRKILTLGFARDRTLLNVRLLPDSD